MTFVETLEAQAVWHHFDQILAIPRGSKEEEQIRRHVIGIAEQLGLDYRTDAAGNIVVKKPATAGRGAAPATVLQGHLDMVNEKNSDVEHDFATDPIKPQRDGEYLKASGTTLGSDNGIGVAAMLAVMEADDLSHGPLEFLFTIDEETGLTGASELDGSLLEGRRLLNLDSEEEGSVYVGCAGGADSTLTLQLRSAPVSADWQPLRLRIHGLKGGHSGVDVHLQRANAVKVIARMLYAVSLNADLRLAEIGGGNKHNAIPREALARIVVSPTQKDATINALRQEFADVLEEFRPADPGMALEIDETGTQGDAWDEATTERVLRLLTSLPHGVLAMSYDIPELVETSTNLATVARDDGSLVIGMSSRSSVDSALTALRRSIRALATLAGADVEEGNRYPGWKPNLESPLLRVLKQVHEQAFGSEPEVRAIHAGLECGIIGEKVPGMDMISFGPQIEFPHSPDERVHVASVGRFYQLLTAALDALSVAR
jgi:dipeptidase D